MESKWKKKANWKNNRRKCARELDKRESERTKP